MQTKIFLFINFRRQRLGNLRNRGYLTVFINDKERLIRSKNLFWIPESYWFICQARPIDLRSLHLETQPRSSGPLSEDWWSSDTRSVHVTCRCDYTRWEKVNGYCWFSSDLVLDDSLSFTDPENWRREPFWECNPTRVLKPLRGLKALRWTHCLWWLTSCQKWLWELTINTMEINFRNAFSRWLWFVVAPLGLPSLCINCLGQGFLTIEWDSKSLLLWEPFFHSESSGWCMPFEVLILFGNHQKWKFKTAAINIM